MYFTILLYCSFVIPGQGVSNTSFHYLIASNMFYKLLGRGGGGATVFIKGIPESNCQNTPTL